MKRNMVLIVLVFVVSLFWFMFPASLGKHYYRKAFELMRLKQDPAQSRVLLNKAIGFNLTYKPIQVALSISYAEEGISCLAKGNYNQALALVRKAIVICPFYTSHYLSLGTIYLRLENYEQALVAYKMALEMSEVISQLDIKAYKEWQSYLKVDLQQVALKIEEVEKMLQDHK